MRATQDNPTTRPIKMPMTFVIGIFIMRCEDEKPLFRGFGGFPYVLSEAKFG